ncbi:hypothetical protein BaRGS_00036360, partial [Batillaria attramentaria]
LMMRLTAGVAAVVGKTAGLPVTAVIVGSACALVVMAMGGLGAREAIRTLLRGC